MERVLGKGEHAAETRLSAYSTVSLASIIKDIKKAT